MPRSRWETHIEPNLPVIARWVRNGVIDKDIAQNLGVAYSTFRKYASTQPELIEILAVTKEVADANVEAALYKRANGYQYEERRQEIIDGEVIKEIVTTKEVIPDVTAQIFWLKNRSAKEWHDKQNIEISKPIDESISEMEAYFEQRKKEE